jgi:hypothetical protein
VAFTTPPNCAPIFWRALIIRPWAFRLSCCECATFSGRMT